MDDRAFPNPYEDYDGEPIMSDDMVKKEKEEYIMKNGKKLLGILDKGLQESSSDEGNHSIYTGKTGIALLKFLISKNLLLSAEERADHLKEAQNFVDSTLANYRIKQLSFLAGDLGPIALGAVIAHEQGDYGKCKHLTSKLLSYSERCCQDESVPDEVLYGRSGYLYCLLFVRKYCGSEYITDKDLEKVCSRILQSGRECSAKEKSRSPLCYYWHNKKYIGAAHGYIGIMYLLLQADVLNLSVVKKSLKDVKGCIDYLLARRFPSGNLPSSIGNESDKLVHWCHGAPGAVHLFARAYKVFGEEKYLEAAEKCGQVIWDRGILRRGYGLCHGVAGNGYGHLALFNLTGDEKYLHRAIKFAEWCCNYGTHGCRTPDRPLSLYEGLAGTVCFLLDVCTPRIARFPGFEL